MRKMVMIMAALALTACDAGKSPTPAHESAASAQVQAPQVSQPKWYIQMNTREAISDTSAWLLERHYAPVIVNLDGKQQILLGPYESQEQGQEQLTGLEAKVAKSHRFAKPALVNRAL
ncbi:hypothetical protein NJC40_13495 [Pseudomonas sp. 21LCFQ02]|uniref:hypothetical protein n=1 Tax=unclassified Pseudomonas TaxID=196821 RepID=UPI0004F8595A|nr:hypothetical protein [Pseudomonas sp. StFLB209]MCO8161950.1 hypothetical protein [Pseudomonas sp. 21LCFQ010]MCO8168782.1 hypothetical protein [Pseudomonas sp. 21LCFQ02]MCQ9426986.1 hypothetical protein [Pseudomonas sp. LJDD11]BAP44983.1 putative uncharacterized protein [Pseudomonas sp. StFLB209]